jgi:hypothetical protein
MSMNDGFSNAQVNPFSRSNAILNQYEPFNISNATDPYQGRSKAWGSQVSIIAFSPYFM